MTLTATETTLAESPTAAFLSKLTAEQQRLYKRIPSRIDYMDHPSFESAATEDDLFGEEAEQVNVPAWTHFPDVPEDLEASRSTRTVLRGAEEGQLFLQYNYARRRLANLIEAQQQRKSTHRAKAMALWFQRVMTIRAKLVRANMALVLAMAKRTRIPNVEFGELVSEGNMALLRSVEKFDVSRGFKFSTYACRAILKSFNRLATKTGRYRQRFPTEFDPDMERSDYDEKKHDIQLEDSLDALREILAQNRANLSDVERTIVMERFAITSRGKGRTLSEVGKVVGLTNERVRQIQNLALEKRRVALDAEYLKV